jgi:hypothetical protein
VTALRHCVHIHSAGGVPSQSTLLHRTLEEDGGYLLEELGLAVVGALVVGVFGVGAPRVLEPRQARHRKGELCETQPRKGGSVRVEFNVKIRRATILYLAFLALVPG